MPSAWTDGSGTAAVHRRRRAARSEGVAPAEYLTLLGLTLALEAPAYFVFWSLERRASGNLAPFAALLVTVNLATHPLVALGFPGFAAYYHLSWAAYAALAEAFAFFVEGLILAQVFGFRWPMAAAASTLANLSSWWFSGYVLNLLRA